MLLSKAMAKDRRFAATRWGALLLLLWVAFGVRPAEVTPQDLSAQNTAGVRVEGDRLTVRLIQAPLGETLKSIADQTGLRIVLNSTIDDRLSLAFAALPVDEGLRRLIAPHHFVFLYTPAGKLEEVRVYAAARPAGHPDSKPPYMEIAAVEEGSALQPTLNDPEPDQRIDAALALSATEESDAGLEVLLDLLQSSKEPKVRERVRFILVLLEVCPASMK